MQKYGFQEYDDIPAEFVWGKEEKAPEKRMDAAEKIYGMGGELIEEETYDAGGFSVPQPGDKVLSKRKMDEEAAALSVETAMAIPKPDVNPKGKE